MSRALRLLQLIETLRRHRFPVTAESLAAELGVSPRTLYRDVATLRAQGAPVMGEAGLGYVLQPGFLLPPLMLQDSEIEALALGARWVAGRGDAALALAARNALAKIAAVLPDDLSDRLDLPSLLAGPSASETDNGMVLDGLRRAIRTEHKTRILYRDGKDDETSRVIWPVAIGFFDHVRVAAAWCELRDSFRHFRLDRITGLDILSERYPRRRAQLLAQWRQSEGIPPSY